MALYIILMGVQGSGKGEQAKFISDQYGIPAISTGDLFRAMKTRTDEFAQRIQNIMAAGKLVDDDTTNEVVRERLNQPDAANGAILDGYPRTPAQAAWLENYLSEQGKKITTVLLLDLDLYIAFKRAFGRVKDVSAGKTYNIYYNSDGIDWAFVNHPDDPNKRFPPRLKATLSGTESELERRADDGNADAVVKRIDVYVEQTQPLIDYFTGRGLLKTIDANQSIAQVSDALRAEIDSARNRQA